MSSEREREKNNNNMKQGASNNSSSSSILMNVCRTVQIGKWEWYSYFIATKKITSVLFNLFSFDDEPEMY